ncbi:MAG: hypothetical protein KA144_04055 [Xanthomonadaceae bacterium]|nr:hypothetical protein [Xanthomonadaceae bacterium]
MNERRALILGSAFAAILVGCFGLCVFFVWSGDVQRIALFIDELLVLAMLPTVIAATISCAWVSGSKRFKERSHISNALRICLLAYPILFFVLLATIWVWLQFNRYLPPYERPGSLLAMATTAASYTVLAFVVGFLPAALIEYSVIRFVRHRFGMLANMGAPR